MSTADTVQASFPKPVLTPIRGLPTYSSIALLTRELNSNSIAVRTDQGGGKHGHLVLTIGEPAFLSLTGHPFKPPPNPGMSPTYSDTATSFEMQAVKLRHDTATTIFSNVRRAFRSGSSRAVVHSGNLLPISIPQTL